MMIAAALLSRIMMIDVSLVEIESGVGSELGHVRIGGVFCQLWCGVVRLGVGIQNWWWSL